MDMYETELAKVESLEEYNEALLALLADDDGDGILNTYDICPQTLSNEEVDLGGCSLEEFCSSFNIKKECKRADWKNDEPKKAKDCTWVRRQCEVKVNRDDDD